MTNASFSIAATPRLGRLVDPVTTSKDVPAWKTGIGALMTNLAHRGLLGGRA
jgi:fumarylacetoacetate (FAA) hydrolase family protein